MPDKTRRIVQECEARGEPYVVFRAQDALTPLVLEFYIEQINRICPPENREELDEGMLEKQREVLQWSGPRKLPD